MNPAGEMPAPAREKQAPRRGTSVIVLFVAVLVALTTLVLGGSTILAYRAESRAKREHLDKDLETTTRQLATGLALPVWNFDQDQTTQILDHLMEDPVTQAVALQVGHDPAESTWRLRGPDGIVRTGQGPGFPLGSSAQPGMIEEEQSITYGGKTLGRVRLVYTTRFLEADRRYLLKSRVGSMLCLDLLLLAGVSLLLWGVVLHPLREIGQLAQVVSSGTVEGAPGLARSYFGELASLQDSLLQTFGLLKARYADLQLSEERFRVLIESTTDLVWSVDRAFRLVSYNSAFAGHLRNTYGVEPFPGATAGMGLPPDRAAVWEPLFSRLFGEGPFIQELTLADGRILELVLNPVVRDGEVVGASVFGKDITQRHKADEELRMHRHHLEELVALRTAELEAARAAAESANASKSAFLANMSHEIRTPMNAVIGLTHLALQTELTDQQRNYLQKARAASENLLGIINDILDFSKIEAGKLQMDDQAFDLEEVVERVTRLAGTWTGDGTLTTRTEIAPDVPRTLVGDPLRLGQVLTNLYSNALKFTGSGEVALGVSLVQASGSRTVLRFSVRDTGIGISPEQAGLLFQPFSQADTSITRKFGGTGLGLAISKHLVDLMGGEIRVESQPGVGSEFQFTAAFGLDPGRVGPAPASSRTGPSPADLEQIRGARILLVEDNEFNQLVATDLLSNLGVEVTLARNGQEALDRIRSGRFQAVLMDLQMPVLDGYETTRQLRADPAMDGLPILAMTAHAMARERERCRALGMEDYLTKPINPDLLASTLARWVRPDGRGDVAAPGRNDRAAAPLARDAGQARFPGQPELYEKMLRRFRELNAGKQGEVRAALATGDPDSAGRIAHSMIAAAGTIGAGRLSAAARDLQDAIRDGIPGQLAPILDRYEEELAGVLEVLRARPRGAADCDHELA